MKYSSETGERGKESEVERNGGLKGKKMEAVIVVVVFRRAVFPPLFCEEFLFFFFDFIRIIMNISRAPAENIFGSLKINERTSKSIQICPLCLFFVLFFLVLLSFLLGFVWNHTQ